MTRYRITQSDTIAIALSLLYTHYYSDIWIYISAHEVCPACAGVTSYPCLVNLTFFSITLKTLHFVNQMVSLFWLLLVVGVLVYFLVLTLAFYFK